MSRILVPMLLLSTVCCATDGPVATDARKLRSGDIVFQDSSPHSGQAAAIKALTGSKWSHCGIYFERPGQVAVVVDGNGRGAVVGWEKWRSGGKDGEFSAYRLKAALSADQREQLWRGAKALDDRPYDLKFSWDDERVYCSELIWKAFRNALKIEVGERQELREFDLESTLARALIERAGSWGTLENARAHGDEAVISPQAITESDLVEEVRN